MCKCTVLFSLAILSVAGLAGWAHAQMELAKLPPGVPAEKSDMPWPWLMNCGWDPDRELLGWSLRNEGSAQGQMKITEANPMNAASGRSLELTVTLSQEAQSSVAQRSVALINSGYWGINVQEGTSYQLKLYLRPGTFQGEVIGLLESKDGQVLASHEFDSARSFAHASYYVQKMFNENRPDVNLATSQDETPRPNPNAPLFAGQFGLGSWHTHSQFKDLRIHDEDGKLVYSDDFATLDGWQEPVRGNWSVEDGILSQSDLGASPSMILLKTPELKTGKVTLKARRADGREGFLMFFNTHGIDRYMFCNYGAAGNRHLAIQGRPAEGCSMLGGKATDRAIEKDRWYEISLEVAKDSARMYLDGQLVADSRVERLNSLFSQAGYDHQDKEVVVKVTNYHGQPVEANIELAGAKRVGKTGRHLLIRSDSPSDQNTLDNPRRIVPSEKPLEGCSKKSSVVLPPYSVNLLRVPAE